MRHQGGTLVCWRSERAGETVLQRAIESLRARAVRIDRVLYLIQRGRERDVPDRVGEVDVEALALEIDDPTRHASIYRAVRDQVCPRLSGTVHVNVSPGTPAMHAVWLILHAGGRLPPGTRLWSSQLDPKTDRVRIDPVDFPVSTYLAELRRIAAGRPHDAIYETEASSPARHDALERLARVARVPGAPLLVLGERGTGKTRVVETHVAALKRRPNVVSVACGGLDSDLAESSLFGHVKGAFSGAVSDRKGLVAEADGGILFLDEVQDLPKSAQRLLVRVLQDRRRRYRPVGSDEEAEADVEVVCASNLPARELRRRLDLDLFDRISLLVVELPPLRSCREDLAEDWRRVWRELRRDEAFPEVAPWSEALERALAGSDLPGNLRDLQRMATLVFGWWMECPSDALPRAIEEWLRDDDASVASDEFGVGTRRDRVRAYAAKMARWARTRWGTWEAAAAALGCDERTLRDDAAHDGEGGAPATSEPPELQSSRGATRVKRVRRRTR